MTLSYDFLGCADGDFDTTFDILGEEYCVDTLQDIANHGCSGGVSGLIYTRDILDKFEAYEDKIMAYLDEFAAGCYGKTAIQMLSDDENVEDLDQLKSKAVWMYVELVAYDTLCEIKHPNFVWFFHLSI